jgi:hypothetical protein
MDTVAIEIERDAAGRFVAGQSGNPAGKTRGTRNRATVLREFLRDGEDEAVSRVVIEKALSGDAAAAMFVLRLTSPRPRGRTIHIEMPEDDDCNVVAAYNSTLRALANGEITPDEALTVSRFLDGRRRTLQAWQLEMQLRSHGRTIPGDPDWEALGADDEDGDAATDEDDAVEPDQPAAALDPELAAAAERAAPPADPTAPAGPAEVQSSGISPASPLQSACISPSPVVRFDQAVAASVAQRPRGGASQR